MNIIATQFIFLLPFLALEGCNFVFDGLKKPLSFKNYWMNFPNQSWEDLRLYLGKQSKWERGTECY